MINEIISMAILLGLIIDPLGNLPIFISVLKYINPKRRRIIIIRELTIALLLMLVFLLVGEKLLIFLNLKIETVSISGGIILFLMSIKMIFPDNKSINDDLLKNKEPFIVPLAIPLISGPAVLSKLIMMSHKYSNNIWISLLIVLIAWIGTFIILIQSSMFLRFLGERSINALERLMGFILIMISVQMFLEGIKI